MVLVDAGRVGERQWDLVHFMQIDHKVDAAVSKKRAEATTASTAAAAANYQPRCSVDMTSS